MCVRTVVVITIDTSHCITLISLTTEQRKTSITTSCSVYFCTYVFLNVWVHVCLSTCLWYVYVCLCIWMYVGTHLLYQTDFSNDSSRNLERLRFCVELDLWITGPSNVFISSSKIQFRYERSTSSEFHMECKYCRSQVGDSTKWSMNAEKNRVPCCGKIFLKSGEF